MENQFCKLFAHTGSAIPWGNVGHPEGKTKYKNIR